MPLVALASSGFAFGGLGSVFFVGRVGRGRLVGIGGVLAKPGLELTGFSLQFLDALILPADMVQQFADEQAKSREGQLLQLGIAELEIHRRILGFSHGAAPGIVWSTERETPSLPAWFVD